MSAIGVGNRTLLGIKREVAAKRDLSIADLEGKSRTRWIVRPRWEAMWMAQQAGWSLSQIGRSFGGRDHTTVLHAVRSYQALLDEAACEKSPAEKQVAYEAQRQAWREANNLPVGRKLDYGHASTTEQPDAD